MPPGPERAARLLTALVVLACGAFLATRWLPGGWTEKELAAAASRVWDLRRALVEHGTLPWWTPWFLGGMPYALQHAQGLPLVPWLALSFAFPLDVAGKLVALATIGTSAAAMFACARAVLGSPWAAALAAVAYALHPQQAFRAAGDEHVGLVIALALLPLAWLGWTRAIETGTLRAALGAALALAALLWTSSRHALVLGMLLGAVTAVRVWAGTIAPRVALRGAAGAVALAVGLSAFAIVPALEESRHARLFRPEDVAEWRRQLSLRSLLGPVDRDGVFTRPAMAAAEPVAVAAPAERAARERLALLKFESGTKYAGGVLLALAAGALLLGRRDAALPVTLALAFVACLAAACGPDGLARAHAATLRALAAVPGVPATTRAAAVAVPLLALAIALAAAWRRGWSAGTGAALGALAVLAVAPVFTALAALPVLTDVRAPFLFYDLPATFLLCLLAGWFVRDVVETRWPRRAPAVVLALVALVLLDHAPAARVVAARPEAARATADIAAAYRFVGAADPEWTRTYYVSTRNQHLLGPMLGGKPQVYEAWTKWMAPLGTGLLNDRSWQSSQANRAYLDLVGARWVVFDRGDPDLMASPLARQMLDFYRAWFPVRLENDAVVVFENAAAWPAISVHRAAALYLGEPPMATDLALALAARGVPLLDLETAGAARVVAVAGGVYVDRDGERRVAARPAPGAPVIPLRGGAVRLPDPATRVHTARVRDVRRRNGAIDFTVDVAEPSLVVVTESWHPHWRARVDGAPARVARVSVGLLGLELPAGSHAVALRFAVPAAYGIAAFVSVATLLGAAVAARRSQRS